MYQNVLSKFKSKLNVEIIPKHNTLCYRRFNYTLNKTILCLLNPKLKLNDFLLN